MSNVAQSWVWQHSPYKGIEFAVHLAIADTVGDEGLFFMRQTKLARKARTTRPTVSRVINKMIDDGLIELRKDNSRNGMVDPNVYLFLTPDDLEQVWTHKTRDGVPGTEPDTSNLAKYAHEVHRERQAQQVAATNLSLLDEDGTPKDDIGASSDTEEGAVVLEVVRDGGDPGEGENATVDVPQDDIDARYESFPLEPVEGEAVIGEYAREGIAFYVDWRRATGQGEMKIRSWFGEIGTALKRTMEKGIPPRIALDALLQWHDENSARGMAKQRYLKPGSIITTAVTLYEQGSTAQYGGDGRGGFRPSEYDRSSQLLDQIIRESPHLDLSDVLTAP